MTRSSVETLDAGTRVTSTETAADTAADGPDPPRWPRWRRRLATAFVVAVLVLIAWAARQVPWVQVGAALHSYSVPVLLAALGITALAYLCYGTFDLLGRRWLRAQVTPMAALRTAMICFALNLSLGSLVGTMASRWRLYGQQGLRPSTIGRMIGFSIATNWLGYAVLAGTVFVAGAIHTPARWPVGPVALRGLGWVLWAIAALYLIACARWRRPFTVRGQSITLPPWPLALLQLAASCLHWLSVAAIAYVLMPPGIPYGLVLSIYLVAALAVVIARVPAGVGVLEAVFVTLLAGHASSAVALAAVLAFRAVYHLLPLALAATWYFTRELRSRLT